MSDRAPSRKPKVVIVGGGTSGLAAAYTLLQSRENFDVTVLEAADRPGGRIAGEEVEGFHIDTGAEIFIDSYSTVRRLADSLGVRLQRPLFVKGGLIFSKGKFRGIYKGGTLKQRIETLKTFLLFRLLSPRATWQMLRFFKMMKNHSKELSIEDPSKLASFDTSESFASFMKNNSMDVYLEDACHVDIAAYTAAYPEEVGAAYGMALLWNFSLNPAEHVCLPEKGVGSFATALVRACSECIRLSTPVERIVIEGGAARGVLTQAGETVEADAVICAAPATVTNRIVPDLPFEFREALSKISYSTVVKVVIGLDFELLSQDIMAAAFPRHSGSFLLVVGNFRCVAPKVAPPGKNLLHAVTVGERARELLFLSDVEIIKRVIGEIQKFFPAMPDTPRFTRVYRWKEALCIAPGGMFKDIQELRQNGMGNIKGLFFAGDYTRVPLSNGALESGVDAAKDSISFLHDETGVLRE